MFKVIQNSTYVQSGLWYRFQQIWIEFLSETFFGSNIKHY